MPEPLFYTTKEATEVLAVGRDLLHARVRLDRHHRISKNPAWVMPSRRLYRFEKRLLLPWWREVCAWVEARDRNDDRDERRTQPADLQMLGKYKARCE